MRYRYLDKIYNVLYIDILRTQPLTCYAEQQFRLKTTLIGLKQRGPSFTICHDV